jgi:WD40 repeat protein
LRTELSRLRQALVAHIVSTRQTVTFNQATPYWLDVAELEQALAAIHQNSKGVELEAPTLDLYQGDFLAGFHLNDAPDFEAWASIERERLHRLTIEGLHHLVSYYLDTAQYKAGIAGARRLLALDEFDEVAYSQLIRLLALNGQLRAAVSHYESYKQLLIREIGVEPGPEVQQLFEQLKTGELSRGKSAVAPLHRIPTPIPPCPYRGLFAFAEADAPFFFGREIFTRRLIEAVHKQSLVAVIGSSGSGKSSVVFAGLLPHLRQEPAPWLITHFRPGRHPFQALAAALLPLLDPSLSQMFLPSETHTLAEQLSQGQLSLAKLVRQIRQRNPQTGPLLLVIDQFEELFTLCADTDLRRQFMSLLLSASQLPASIFCLLFTMRADYLDHALIDRRWADALQGADLKLGPMIRSELTQAIERPAQRHDVTFESGLVDRILDDVGSEPGNLPLLEFALTLLWSHQTERQLTHVTYETIGRVTGALARYADEIYHQLSLADQERARRIFIQLVQPSIGPKDTRRVASRIEIGENNWPLVQWLADARLVVTDQGLEGQETLEIVHETLIRNWDQLRSWMVTERAFRTWQERLRLSLQQWQASQQDEEVLLRGALLTEAEAWAKSRRTDLSQAEQEYVETSLALRDQRLRAQEAQHQRELSQAQALAEMEHNQAEMALFALRKQQEAERQSRLAISAQLAAQVDTVLDIYPQRSLLLAVEALKVTLQANEPRLPAAEQALRQALAHISGRNLSGHPQDIITALAISPDNHWLATGSADNAARLWDLQQPAAAPIVLNGHEGAVQTVALSPDNQWLVTGSADNTVRLWNMANPTASPLVLRGHKGAVQTVALSPDNQWLVTGSADNTVRLWNMADPTATSIVLNGHEGAVQAVAISSDNRWLATAGVDNTARLWDLADPTITSFVLSGHMSGVTMVAFSPDNHWLVTAGDWPDNTARLWDITAPTTAAPFILRGHRSGVSAAVFSHDNHWLATGSGMDGDNSIRLWDLQNLAADPLILRGHDGHISNLIISPDSHWLVSSSADRTIRLWNLSDPTRPPEPLTLRGHDESILSLSFSLDEQWLVSSSADSTIRLWDLSELTAPPIVLRGHEQQVNAVAISPNSCWLVSGGQEGTVLLWDLIDLTNQPFVLDSHHQGPIWTVAISFDNCWLATAGGDRTICLWSLADLSAAPAILIGHEDTVLAVTFSPDNHWLVSGSLDRTVRLWNLQDLAAEPRVLSGHDKAVSAVAISPDRHWLASGSWDKTIRLWDLQNLTDPPMVLTDHTSGLSSLAFSPDNHWLASGSGDKTLRLWDLTNLTAAPVILSRHDQTVSAVAFSPNSHWLASGSWDKTIRLWNLDLSELMALACRTANRNLTAEEWRQYFRGQTYRPTCSDFPPG